MAFASLNGVYVKDYEQRVLERLIDRSITKIEIPNGITRIGPGAFEGCGLVTGTVTVPEGVARMEMHAFSGCEGITELILPESLGYIGGNALSAMYSLKRLVLPPKVTTLPSTMAANSGFTEFVAEGDVGLGYVGPAAFQNCSNCLSYDFTHCTRLPPLHSVNAFTGINPEAKIYVPAELYKEWIVATNWAAYADYIVGVGDGIYGELEYSLNDGGASYTVVGIGSYDSIDDGLDLIIPSEYEGLPVTAIGEDAFIGNEDITSVSISSSVTSIGAEAFADCSNLSSVSIPSSVTSIGAAAFADCANLSHVYFNAATMADCALADGIFARAGQSGDGITVVIGKDVEEIPSYLFYGGYPSSGYSPNVKSVEFEEGSICRGIGNSAFYYCMALESFVAPAGLQHIGAYALYIITYDAVLDFSACTQIPALAHRELSASKIYVPEALYDEWIVATNWSANASKIVAK